MRGLAAFDLPFGHRFKSEKVPFASGSQKADSVVRFASGAHSTILDPTAGTSDGGVDPADGAATTAEMQCESAGFLATAAAGAASPKIPLGCQ